MKTMLGIDLGTSGVKVIAVKQNGDVVAKATAEYPLIQLRSGWSEQNPQDWWDGVLSAIGQIVSNRDVSPESIAAISLSGQMHGSVFLDSEGKVIRNALLWNDTRTYQECEFITRTIGEEHLLELVGNPALEGFTAPKVLWLRENEPENYSRLRTLLLPKDYLLYKLTGRLCTEMSDAAGTLLLDVSQRTWSEEIIRSLDLDPNIFPELLESTDIVGTLKTDLASSLGLDAGVQVVAGGADNACAAVGNGVVEEGIVLVSIGSSGTVLTQTDKMRYDPKGRIHSFCHSVPSKWYLMGVMLSAGLSMSWLKNEILMTDNDTINAEASKVPPGSEGVIFSPYLFGERTPHRDSKARGTFFGLSSFHTRGHLIRSVFEGVAFGLKESLDLLSKMGVCPNEIRLTGGGAKSSLWCQILSDVLNSPVVLMESDEGPAYGAALIAAAGVGIFPDLPNAARSTVKTKGCITPDPLNAKLYAEIYPVYQGLYASLKDQYAEAFRIFNK